MNPFSYKLSLIGRLDGQHQLTIRSYYLFNYQLLKLRKSIYTLIIISIWVFSEHFNMELFL